METTKIAVFKGKQVRKTLHKDETQGKRNDGD
jgi:hypothetical protein